jgi:putative flippase GtrA
MRFGVVGLSNTAIAWITYYGLTYFAGFHYQAANIIAFFTSVTNAYIWNRLWVFKDKEINKGTPVKFLAVYGGNLLFGVALAFVFVEIFKINKYVLPPLSLCITVPVNFLLNRYWVFKKERG